MAKNKITGKDVVELRLRLGLTQREFGKLLSVSCATVGNWERTDCDMSDQIGEDFLLMSGICDKNVSMDILTMSDFSTGLMATIRGKLPEIFSKYQDFIPESYLEILRGKTLATTLFAMLLNASIRSLPGGVDPLEDARNTGLLDKSREFPVYHSGVNRPYFKLRKGRNLPPAQ